MTGVSHLLEVDRLHTIAHQHLGQIATLRGRLADADDALYRALILAHYLHDSVAAASVLNRLGLLESARSRLRSAIACHEVAYRIGMSVGDARGTYIALTNLAKCRVDNHDATGAIDAIRVGMALAEEARDEDAMTLLLHHKANAQAALGNYDEAIRTHLYNLALIRKRGLREGEAWTLAHLARSYLAVDRPEDAAQSLEASLAIFDALGATGRDPGLSVGSPPPCMGG